MNNKSNNKENFYTSSLEYQILKTRWKTPWWKLPAITSRIKKFYYEQKFEYDLSYINLSRKTNNNYKNKE